MQALPVRPILRQRDVQTAPGGNDRDIGAHVVAYGECCVQC